MTCREAAVEQALGGNTIVTKASAAAPSSLRDGKALGDLAARALARVCAEAQAAAGVTTDTKAYMGIPHIVALATALCEDDTETADAIIADLLEVGLTVEEVCLDHLAPAARQLGQWWEDDKRPFTDVALASARIHVILRGLSATRRVRTFASDRGALFASAPGEQHILGVVMAAALFRSDGWDVTLLVGLDHDTLLDRFINDDRPLIGLSSSGDHSLDGLRQLMEAVRDRRPDARLILSGGIVLLPERLAKLPKPDAVITDLRMAEAEMTRLYPRATPSRGPQSASSAA